MRTHRPYRTAASGCHDWSMNCSSNLSDSHFWGMDEWYVNGKEVDATHPLSFEKADRELCFNRIDKKYRMPDSNHAFSKS